MPKDQKEVNLGFAEVTIPPGTHICQIYSDEDERNDALLKFLLSGLLAKEQTACFSEKTSAEKLRHFFLQHNLDMDSLNKQGDFTLAKTNDVYFRNGTFDPDYMLDMLTNYHETACDRGYPGARVIGEMTPKINQVPGGAKLFDYESRVNSLLKKHPIVAVCQYDAHAFDGATIMDVMKVHPMMLVRGNIIHNPFYVPAQEYLN